MNVAKSSQKSLYCATIAHQERYGQLGKNQKILGATAAAANKVIFQTTERDAQELAPGFASLPPQETKQEPALAISPHPFWDLVERDMVIHSFRSVLMNGLSRLYDKLNIARSG